MTSVVMTAEEIARANAELVTASAEDVLRWATAKFGHGLTMATAFGAEGCCIIHMLATIDPSVRIFNLDTGYQFDETLDLRERLLARYGIAVEYVRPELTVEEYEAGWGKGLGGRAIRAARESGGLRDRPRRGKGRDRTNDGNGCNSHTQPTPATPYLNRHRSLLYSAAPPESNGYPRDRARRAETDGIAGAGQVEFMLLTGCPA